MHGMASRVRWTAGPRTRTIVAALVLAMALAGASGGCTSSGPAISNTRTTAAALDACAGAVVVGEGCCKVGATVPAVDTGLVRGSVEVSCNQPADVYVLTVFLYHADKRADATPGDEVDVCTQSDPDDVGLLPAEGVRCHVGASCKPGYYVVAYDLDVGLGDTTQNAADDGTYAAPFTQADCRV
jgi:hypothetical protein